MRASGTAMADRERSAGDTTPLPVARSMLTGIAAGRQAVPFRDAGMDVTSLDLGASAAIDLPASAARVGLAMLIEGDACFETDGASMRVPVGQTILNACHGVVRCKWPEGGRVILATLTRSAIQAGASAGHGGARRLARAVFVIGAGDSLAVPAEAKANAVIEAVVTRLAAEHGIDEACPASRSISLARRRLDADPARAWDLEDLARGVGVTPVTLQRGFRDCIGATVAGYAQAIRLGEARGRLTNGRETRPLSAIAHAAGFASVTAFVRAYQRVFGETPTRTRADSVRYFDGDHIESG